MNPTARTYHKICQNLKTNALVFGTITGRQNKNYRLLQIKILLHFINYLQENGVHFDLYCMPAPMLYIKSPILHVYIKLHCT